MYGSEVSVTQAACGYCDVTAAEAAACAAMRRMLLLDVSCRSCGASLRAKYQVSVLWPNITAAAVASFHAADMALVLAQ